MVETVSELREAAGSIFRAGLLAADPYRILMEHFHRVAGGFRVFDEPLFPGPGPNGSLHLFGAGKAAASLARALEERLPGEPLSGRVIVKHGHGEALERITLEEGGHPLPDEDGFRATERLLADLEGLSSEDRVLFLLTGGASALLVAPVEGVSLEDKVATTRELLASGATIQEMNALRKHLSAVKGGRLLERMAPALVMTLIVSDVVGDDLPSIGSGPTVGDPSTFGDCLRILKRYRLLERVPAAVRRHLEAGRSGLVSETPKPGASLFDGTRKVILASNRQSLEAAADRASSLGFEVELFARDMVGSTHQRARELCEALLLRRARAANPVAILAGGETTLEVKGKGLGGRNQEFALVAARELEGREKILVLAAGTDGTDGPTDAAGAFADGGTLARAAKLGIDAEAVLLDNNSYYLFDRLGDLLRTGPTGTNVMDLVIGLAG